MFRKIIKRIWKITMYILTKIYTKNFNLYHINRIEKLPRGESYSQFSQDIYAYKFLFKEKKNGVFVDVGGNHPINCNNTYLFEKNGWTGLAIEPQDVLRDLWQNTRKTKCLPYIIGPENKKVEFVEGGDNEHGLSGVMGFNKVTNNHKIKLIDQKKLTDILLENNIKKVDFLSIDVEGYEMQVLNSLDFSKIDVDVICLENDIGFKKLGSELGNNKIRNYLKNKGYKHVARLMCDDFFIKK